MGRAMHRTIVLRIAIRMSVRAPAVVLFRIRSPIAHRSPALHPGHIHLSRVTLVALAADRRHEIDEEAEDVEEVNKRDGPLQNRCGVPLFLFTADAEPDREAHFDKDKGQFDPKARSEDAVLAEVDTQALVLPADEDGADYVPDDEDAEENVVEFAVVDCVENREEDEAGGAGDGGYDTDAAVDFLPDGSVAGEFAGVS